jgi:hypothetical protein
MGDIKLTTSALDDLATRADLLMRRYMVTGDVLDINYYDGFATGVRVALDVLAAVDPAAEAAGWCT